MKKLSIVFVFIILCVGCSGSRIKKGSIKEYRLQLMTQDTENSPSFKGISAFAQKLEELSGGTMTLSISNIGYINHVSELINPVIAGEFDIALSIYDYLSYAIPELELIAQAYVTTDYENYIKTLDSDYGRKMNREIAKIGLIPSEIWFLGTRHTTSNYPINSLADFRGLKLRVPPIDSSIAFARSMGAIATPINLSELYNSLRLQYVHAQENSLSTIESHKLYEIQKYIAITGHSLTAGTLFLNKKVYDSFSAEQEAWYNEALEYGRQVCYDIVADEEEYLLDKFQNEYGMIVTYPDRNELREAMHSHYDEIEEKFGKGRIYSLVAIE